MIFNKVHKLYRLFITHTYYKLMLSSVGRKSIIYKPIWSSNLKYVSIGKSAMVFPNCRIELINTYQGVKFSPELVLGDYSQIHQNAHITCANSIKIHKNVIIVSNVTITDIIHPHKNGIFPLNKNPIKTLRVEIGENSQIYNNCTILPGTRIGKNSIIAANSVVKGEFPDYVILAGSPAKIVKKFNEKTKVWEKY